MQSRRSFVVLAASGLISAPSASLAAPRGGRSLKIGLDFVENFLGRGDVAAADRTLDPAVSVTTGLSPQGPIQGLEVYKKIFLQFHSAFPPIDESQPVRIVDAFDARDRAVVRFHFRGRHALDYFGVKATGREILFDETHVMRIRDGKIIENVVSATNLEFEMLLAPVLTPLILK